MTPRPPTSPLFPYTTLFRSHGDAARGQRAHEREEPLDLFARQARRGLVEHQHARRAAQRARDLDQLALGDRQAGDRDRKSTRLNSSHMSISYAVFCLKKKKK